MLAVLWPLPASRMAEIEATVLDINQSLRGRGIEIELFKPGASIKKDGLAEVPVEIRAKSSYQDLVAWLQDIRRLPRLVLVDLRAVETSEAGGVIVDARLSVIEGDSRKPWVFTGCQAGRVR